MPAHVRTVIAQHRSALGERRRLAAADRTAAMLGRLASVQTVLERADAVVAGGWVQCAWFAEGDADGPAAACLVGAIVRAAGGDRSAERAQKAIAVAWSTMLGRDDDPDASIAPAVRVARVRELTAWNDVPGRTADEVRALLSASVERVGAARRRALAAGVPA